MPWISLNPADAGEILTLQRAAYLDEAREHSDWNLPPLLESMDCIAADLAKPEVYGLGYRSDNRLLGVVRLEFEGEVAIIKRLAVVPDRQGEGFGSRLLDRVENLAWQFRPPVREIRLFTGEHSNGPLHLYARRGYIETHRTPVGAYHLVHLRKPRPSRHE